MKTSKPSTPIYIDPVCLIKVDPAGQARTFTYRMRTYYFCTDSCRQAFEADPKKYSEEQDSPKAKGWWARYLERLNKATGGKPPKCCG